MILTSGDICTRLLNTNRDMFNPIFAHPFSYRICSIELCITREVLTFQILSSTLNNGAFCT